MFRALELSIEAPLERSSVNPTSLATKLRTIEQCPESKRAFPNDDGSFRAAFDAVVQLELQRDDGDVSTDPSDILHDPCYDIQSIYWWLLWYFCRALPVGREPLAKRDDEFSTFADMMLNHRVGNEELRQHYLLVPLGRAAIIHPELKHFATFFKDLATYLKIPWHIYKKHPGVKLSREHAHFAMRRLLLAEILALQCEKKAHNLRLDTRQPRIIDSTSRAVTDIKTQLTTRDTMAITKRKADTAGLDQSAQSLKRVKEG